MYSSDGFSTCCGFVAVHVGAGYHSSHAEPAYRTGVFLMYFILIANDSAASVAIHCYCIAVLLYDTSCA